MEKAHDEVEQAWREYAEALATGKDVKKKREAYFTVLMITSQKLKHRALEEEYEDD
ncbi:MAG: hypothetical protein GTO24_21040 [candidate division Zixibacteria bacterium]|nr:hypothetical protein [candidate division Zixibacteria bacterium]